MVKMAIMLKYCLRLTLIFCILIACIFANEISTEDKIQYMYGRTSSPFDAFEENEIEDSNNIEAFIETVEQLAAQAEKAVKEGILPIDNIHKIYSKIEETVEELVDLLNETINIYKFLNAKGIERIVLPNIGIPHSSLKIQLLLLMKNLFNGAPSTTKVVIPIGLVDKVLDIFEHDNLALKAHALDILCSWLPENPLIQTRVMKMKGLEPFYQQITKLDADVIAQMLELFNKILTEHLKARKKDVQRNKADYDKLVLYQRIGLIERLSSPVACNGLLHILETTWSFNTEGKEISRPIIEAIKNIHPFCINFFKAKPKRTKLFHELLKYIGNPVRKNNFEELGLNITETEIVLKEYSNIFKDVFAKDEF